jgi:tetratricopeptide (TPR) repeat protein
MPPAPPTSEDSRLRLYRPFLVLGAAALGVACAGGLAYEIATERRLPPPAETYYLKVRKALEAGDHDYVIAQCRIGVAIRPDYDEGYLDMADAWAAKGSAGDQVRAYEDLLRVHPRHNVAHGRLAEIYAATGRLDDALLHYRALLDVEPRNDGARYNLGVCLLEAGRPAEAKAELERAIEINPSDARAHNNLGVAFVRLGRLDLAASAFGAAASLDPGNENYARNLAEARRRASAPACVPGGAN